MAAIREGEATEAEGDNTAGEGSLLLPLLLGLWEGPSKGSCSPWLLSLSIRTTGTVAL